MDRCVWGSFFYYFLIFRFSILAFHYFPFCAGRMDARNRVFIIHRVRICLLLCCAVESFNFAFLLLFIFIFSGSVKRAGRGRNRISGGGSGGSTEEETELDGWMDGVGEGVRKKKVKIWSPPLLSVMGLDREKNRITL